MPQITSFVLADGAATPVNHTFNTTGVQTEKGETTVFLAGDDSEPHLRDRVTVSSRLLGDGARVTKLKLTQNFLHDSTSETNATQKTFEQNICKVEFRLNDLSDTQIREDIRAMMMSLLADLDVISLVDGFEAPWG